MHFYVLPLRLDKLPYSEFELVGKPDRGEPPTCKGCGVRLRSPIPQPPHNYRLCGDQLGDLITDGLCFAVSAELKEAYEDSNLMGLEFSGQPICLEGTNASYFFANSRCTYTLLDEKASGVVIDELRGCELCRVMAVKRIDRIVINESTWSGEDNFKLGGVFNMDLVSQKFVDFVDDHGFTNFDFVDQDDFFVCFEF